RFGSYSMAATFAGIPNLSRLKSMMRYACLWPPEINREVTRPVLLRPPDFGRGPTSDFSGSFFVRPSRVTMVMKRRLGVVGENFFIPMVCLHLRELGDLLAGHEFHVCFLPVRAVSGKASAAAQFAVEIRRPYLFHFYVE